jgi:hypothetical protein
VIAILLAIRGIAQFSQNRRVSLVKPLRIETKSAALKSAAQLRSMPLKMRQTYT